MAAIKRASHIRSLLKGISWRIVATTDTILVVWILTCSSGTCNLQSAYAIGFWEFFLKFFIYYVHERVWERFPQKNRESKKVTLIKSISWRLVATSTTFILSGVILEGNHKLAFYIAIVELFTKFALYYGHERLWLRLPLGRVRKVFQNLWKK